MRVLSFGRYISQLIQPGGEQVTTAAHVCRIAHKNAVFASISHISVMGVDELEASNILVSDMLKIVVLLI